MDLSKEIATLQEPSPKSINKLLMTLNESRGDDKVKSAFSPYQKSPFQKSPKAQLLQPFNGEQEVFMEEAHRYFGSFFTTPGNPEDSLLSALPPLPSPSLLRSSSPPSKLPLTKAQFCEMKKEYAIPIKAPPSQPQCYCSCCNQWKLYLDPPRSEFYSRSCPRLCFCACCREWNVYLHFVHNTPVVGYYDLKLFTPPGIETKKKEKRVTRGPRRGRGGARKGGEKVVENKENSDGPGPSTSGRGRRKKDGKARQFTQKSLMKKDPTLKLNNAFQPQIPYLTPLDS